MSDSIVNCGVNKCSYDPREMTGCAIGMFHCPECGEIVLAGMKHPDWDSIKHEVVHE